MTPSRTGPDTSREAVECIIEYFHSIGEPDSADTVRALLTERDSAKEQVKAFADRLFEAGAEVADLTARLRECRAALVAGGDGGSYGCLGNDARP